MNINTETLLKIRDYMISYDSVLVLMLILSCILNILINHNKPSVILALNIIFIIIYFYISNKSKKEKIILIITLFHFALWGVLIENIIISKTKILEYNSTFKDTDVPLWLFTAYSIFAIGALYTYNLFKLVFIN